jgi:hypothetical protein
VRPLNDLFTASEFRAGLWAGALAALVVVTAAAPVRFRARRSGTPRPRPPVAGWVFAAAGLAALAGLGPWEEVAHVPDRLLWGMAALGVGAGVGGRIRPRPVMRAVGALPGALLVAYDTGLPGDPWVRVSVAAVCSLGAALAADLDERGSRVGLGPVLFAVAVFAAYTTVPDTEMTRVLVGVALPVAVLGGAGAWVRLGAGGVAAAFGLLCWVVAFEGAPRPGSVVGALGALGLLLTEPVGYALRPRSERVLRARPHHGPVVALVVVAQAVLAAYAARVAGFETDPGPAAALLAPVVLAGVLLGAGLGVDARVSRRRRYRYRRTRAAPGGRRSRRAGRVRARGGAGAPGVPAVPAGTSGPPDLIEPAGCPGG